MIFELPQSVFMAPATKKKADLLKSGFSLQMEMHNLAAVNAAIAAIETSAELENEPVSLEAQDDKEITCWPWIGRSDWGLVGSGFVRPCNA